MVLVALHGVHGAGKSFLARILSEDYGFRLVLADAAESWPEVVTFHPFSRQMVYASESLLHYARALEMARRENVVMDFAPRHSIPYVRWFFRDAPETAEYLANLLDEAATQLERAVPVEVINVFLIVKSDYDVLVERIKRRARDGFVEEEVDREFATFVNEEMRKLADDMEARGMNVVRIRADGKLIEKLKELESKVLGYVEVRRPGFEPGSSAWKADVLPG